MVLELEPWLDASREEWRVIDVEEWAEIRRLYRAEGLSIKEIARRLGVARNTVRSALRSDVPPVFDRKPRPSAIDGFEPQIRELLAEFPRKPATVIAERVGWTRSMTVMKDRVRELRPLYLSADPCQRTEYQPGELAERDLWFPPVKIPLGNAQEATLPVIVGVSGYSRWITVSGVRTRSSRCGEVIFVDESAENIATAKVVERHRGRSRPLADHPVLEDLDRDEVDAGCSAQRRSSALVRDGDG